MQEIQEHAEKALEDLKKAGDNSTYLKRVETEVKRIKAIADEEIARMEKEDKEDEELNPNV